MISPLLERNRLVDGDEELVKIHHHMMAVYGWIPLEDFKKMPIPTFWNLWKESIEELKSKEKFKTAVFGIAKSMGVKLRE